MRESLKQGLRSARVPHQLATGGFVHSGSTRVAGTPLGTSTNSGAQRRAGHAVKSFCLKLYVITYHSGCCWACGVRKARGDTLAATSGLSPTTPAGRHPAVSRMTRTSPHACLTASTGDVTVVAHCDHGWFSVDDRQGRHATRAANRDHYERHHGWTNRVCQVRHGSTVRDWNVQWPCQWVVRVIPSDRGRIVCHSAYAALLVQAGLCSSCWSAS